MQRPPSVCTVTIPFADLKRDKDLGGKIEEGLGPHGLGIISIADECVCFTYSGITLGGVMGRRNLSQGNLTHSKVFFYANPILDVPTTDDVLVSRYPSYCRPNIWPTDHLSELEIAFKALGKLMLEVGLMLAHHCDHCVMQQGVGNYDGESLEQTIARSRCHKGYLLYYFPRQFRYYLNRSSSYKFYQIGETTEILSRGHLCATPHCVQAPSSENASGVERCTFAMFMQPDWDEKLKFPSEIPHHQELIPPNGTLTFGEYSERLVNKYYQART